jgi:hypothetical protein
MKVERVRFALGGLFAQVALSADSFGALDRMDARVHLRIEFRLRSWCVV